MIELENIFAWLDGELEPDEAARVEAAVAADPELSRLADEHRSMGASLKQAFDPIAAAPVPDRISQAAHASRSNTVDLDAFREKRRLAFGAPQWAALAATLALGVALGVTLNSGGTSAPVEVRNGNLYAASEVDRALDTQLAGSTEADIRIGLTYRDRTGAICRTFESSGSSGLACRNGDRWRLRGLFAAPEGQSEAYRMASGQDPRLMDMVDASIAGDPFDSNQEKAARDRQWR